jgi:hypothetical protein
MDAVRTTNRIVSALLAVALVVGGVLVAIEVVLASLDRGPWVLPHEDWAGNASETAYTDRSARILFLLLALAGLALLLLELVRRRPPALQLTDRDGGVEADLDRRGVERWLSTRLSGVEGVAGTKAKITRRAVEVTAQTPQRDVGDLQRRLEGAAQENLDQLGLAQPLRARAKVTSRRSG